MFRFHLTTILNLRLGLIAGLRRAENIRRSGGWLALFRHTLRPSLWLPRLVDSLRSPWGPMVVEVRTEITSFALPRSEEPRVSIVVPVHNNLHYTYNCLRAISERSGGLAYEVIVVDDASTDRTQAMLALVDGVRNHRLDQNVGFVNACNEGARLARGEYIVFLNNDTQVQPGWLDALVGRLDRDASVAIAGAKLIYPDGTLQEAGSIIWQDGDGWNYGRFASPQAPEYSFAREVDYCSAACIAVRGDFFRAVGGFDTSFAPAYYEDADLAFSARSVGMKVVYEPRAQVVHFEGVSNGVRMDQGVKRYQLVNRGKFAQKWKDVLEREHLDHREPPLLGRGRQRGVLARALVVDHYVPTPDRDSGSLRMFSILKILRRLGCAVTFVPQNMAPAEPYTSALQAEGIEVVYEVASPGSWLEHSGPFDFAILSRPDVAEEYLPMLRQRRLAPTIIYDTVDLHYLREERRAATERSRQARDNADRLRALELSLVRACDATITVSESERALLEREVPGSRVYVVPNIHAVSDGWPGFENREGLLFVGSFSHPPNRDAVLYFTREVLPLVRQALGPVTFNVIGPEAGPEISRLPGVNYLGWVPDVLPHLDRARVFVAPMRYGAGMLGKVGQSMAAGLPVVASSVAAEGIGLRHGIEGLIADEPAAFASCVAKLHQSETLWQDLSASSVAFIRERYSTERVEEIIQDVLAREGIRVAAR
jgi:O-antigen biosynthesis protein